MTEDMQREVLDHVAHSIAVSARLAMAQYEADPDYWALMESAFCLACREVKNVKLFGKAPPSER